MGLESGVDGIGLSHHTASPYRRRTRAPFFAPVGPPPESHRLSAPRSSSRFLEVSASHRTRWRPRQESNLPPTASEAAPGVLMRSNLCCGVSNSEELRGLRSNPSTPVTTCSRTPHALDRTLLHP